jgi:hypothetical protein
MFIINCSGSHPKKLSNDNDDASIDSKIECVPENEVVVFRTRVDPPVLTDIPPVKFGAPPLVAGMGPETAEQCAPASAALPGQSPNPNVIRNCFVNTVDNTPQATIERVLESINDKSYVHVRLTFNPYFVDNSYGTNAIGWTNSKSGKHNFTDLVGSDHAELLFTDKNNTVVLHLKLDYISATASQVSGYGSLGVTGGEGSVIEGKASDVLKVTTSLTRNLNFCGYKDYIVNSPATDLLYTPNPATPNWDYRVVYEMWVASSAFGSTGLGNIYVEYVHASPSKLGTNTLTVDEKPCPPDTETPDGGTTGGGTTGGTTGSTTGGTTGSSTGGTTGSTTGGTTGSTTGGTTGSTTGGTTGGYHDGGPHDCKVYDCGPSDGGVSDSGVPVQEVCPPGFVPKPPNYWGDVL